MPGLPDELVLFRGRMVVAYAVEESGQSMARDFLNSRDVTEKDKRKLHRLFEQMAQQGEIVNDQNFKKLEGRSEVHEFKGHKARVFAFRSGGTWFLTSGVVKKRDLHRPSDIDRAERLWQQHKNWMTQQGIT